MAAFKDHVLVLPKFVFVLRCLQLVTAVAVMGLMAFGIYYLSFDGDNLMMFTAVATLVITVYIIVAETCAPVIYNYWAILGLDIFAIIFWLVSFAYLASEVAAYQIVNYSSSSTCTYYYGYCVKKRSLDLTKRTTVYEYRNSLAAASGLGGLEFILFIITLVMTSLALHRHRKAGNHSVANAATDPSSTNPTYPDASYSNNHAPSIATTAVEPKADMHDASAYTHQPAQPMTATGTGQSFGAQPAYT